MERLLSNDDDAAAYVLSNALQDINANAGGHGHPSQYSAR